jgi:hypothetical protein
LVLPDRTRALAAIAHGRGDSLARKKRASPTRYLRNFTRGSPPPTALKGDTERATAELAEARKLSGDGRFASIARRKAAPGERAAPKIRALLDATYLAGLHKAGLHKVSMPEE